MPLMRCDNEGKPGWKFGDTGACYVYTPGDEASEKEARRKAVQQALAMNGGKPPADLGEITDIDIEALEAALPPREEDEDDEAYGARLLTELASDTSLVPKPLETQDLERIAILKVGGPYFGKGSKPGGDFFDAKRIERLAADTAKLVDEYNEVKPPNKIGHSDEQTLLRNSGLSDDEAPAGGWLSKFRVEGGTIYADVKRVPQKLANLIRAGAFRTRSAELRTVTSQTDGKQYQVIAGLGWLGAKAPAVRTLDDIAALYGDGKDVDGMSVVWFEDEADAALHYVNYDTASKEEEVPAKPADTSGVQTATPTLSDEIITTLAETFEISEDDAAKRRELVEAKLRKEFTEEPKPEEEKPVEVKLPEGTKLLTEVEYDALVAKADAGAAAAEGRRVEARDALIDAAVREGKLDPAKSDDWKKHYDENESLTVQLLAELPVNEEFLRVYGEDGDGKTPDEAKTVFDEAYAEYIEFVGGN